MNASGHNLSNPEILIFGAFALTALSMLLSLVLFVLAKAEFRRLAARLQQESECLAEQQREVRARLEQMEGEIRSVAAVGERPAEPPKASLNLSRRAQVLRLARKGERAEAIAATLSIPQNEVELLLKLHRAAQATLQ